MYLLVFGGPTLSGKEKGHLKRVGLGDAVARSSARYLPVPLAPSTVAQ